MPTREELIKRAELISRAKSIAAQKTPAQVQPAEDNRGFISKAAEFIQNVPTYLGQAALGIPEFATRMRATERQQAEERAKILGKKVSPLGVGMEKSELERQRLAPTIDLQTGKVTEFAQLTPEQQRERNTQFLKEYQRQQQETFLGVRKNISLADLAGKKLPFQTVPLVSEEAGKPFETPTEALGAAGEAVLEAATLGTAGGLKFTQMGFKELASGSIKQGFKDLAKGVGIDVGIASGFGVTTALQEEDPTLKKVVTRAAQTAPFGVLPTGLIGGGKLTKATTKAGYKHVAKPLAKYVTKPFAPENLVLKGMGVEGQTTKIVSANKLIKDAKLPYKNFADYAVKKGIAVGDRKQMAQNARNLFNAQYAAKQPLLDSITKKISVQPHHQKLVDDLIAIFQRADDADSVAILNALKQKIDKGIALTAKEADTLRAFGHEISPPGSMTTSAQRKGMRNNANKISGELYALDETNRLRDINTDLRIIKPESARGSLINTLEATHLRDKGIGNLFKLQNLLKTSLFSGTAAFYNPVIGVPLLVGEAALSSPRIAAALGAKFMGKKSPAFVKKAAPPLPTAIKPFSQLQLKEPSFIPAKAPKELPIPKKAALPETAKVTPLEKSRLMAEARRIEATGMGNVPRETKIQNLQRLKTLYAKIGDTNEVRRVEADIKHFSAPKEPLKVQPKQDDFLKEMEKFEKKSGIRTVDQNAYKKLFTPEELSMPENQALASIYAEFEAAMQGGVTTVIGDLQSGELTRMSAYPKWIPKEFRTKRDITAILNVIEKGKKPTDNQREFLKIIKEEMDKRVGREELVSLGRPTQVKPQKVPKKLPQPEKKKTLPSKTELFPETKPKEKIELLPKEEAVWQEAKRTGAKRIAPDRVPHQQVTPDEAMKKILESKKKRFQKNADSWLDAIAQIEKLQKKYGEKLPVRSKSNLEKYPDLADDFRKFAGLRKNAVGTSSLAGVKKQFQSNADHWLKKEVSQEALKKEYIELIKKDISKGYKYPEAVIDYDKSFKVAVNNRERYEKGLRTSFSVDDPRIVFEDVDKIGAGMKRQDGKLITDKQKVEIKEGVIDFSDALGLDMKKLAEQERWVYVHLNDKNPFLRKNLAGLYRKDQGNVSISVGGRESFEKVVNGKKVKEHVHPTMAHELGHAIDYMSDHKMFSRDFIRKRQNDIVVHPETSYYRRKYYKSPTEIRARMIEQYVAVQKGDTSSFGKQGQWTKEVFENEIKPEVEKVIKEHFSEYIKKR